MWATHITLLLAGFTHPPRKIKDKRRFPNSEALFMIPPNLFMIVQNLFGDFSKFKSSCTKKESL